MPLNCGIFSASFHFIFSYLFLIFSSTTKYKILTSQEIKLHALILPCYIEKNGTKPGTYFTAQQHHLCSREFHSSKKKMEPLAQFVTQNNCMSLPPLPLLPSLLVAVIMITLACPSAKSSSCESAAEAAAELCFLAHNRYESLPPHLLQLHCVLSGTGCTLSIFIHSIYSHEFH